MPTVHGMRAALDPLHMELTDLLSRVGVLQPRDHLSAEIAVTEHGPDSLKATDGNAGTGATNRSRLDALLPTSGLSLGPPEVDDRLDLSPLAHAILRAVDQLDQAQSARVSMLRAGYLREGLELDEDLLAARLLHAAFSETAAESASHTAQAGIHTDGR